MFSHPLAACIFSLETYMKSFVSKFQTNEQQEELFVTPCLESSKPKKLSNRKTDLNARQRHLIRHLGEHANLLASHKNSESVVIRKLMKLFSKLLDKDNQYKTAWDDLSSEEYIELINLIKKLVDPKSHYHIYSEIREVCLNRSKKIAGTTKDFNCHFSLLNQVYYALARIITPEHQSPLVLLYEQETHAHYDKNFIRWHNVYEGTEDLPEQPGLAIRVHGNTPSVSLVEHVLSRARARVSENYCGWKNIFLVSDARVSHCEQHLPLSTIEFLQKTSPGFKKIFELSNLKQNGYVAQFSALRQGLLEGDEYHQGTDENAASPANLALVKFFDWWRTVPQSDKDRIRSVQSGGYASRSIGNMLDTLEDPRKYMGAIRTCIQMIGDRFDRVLSSKNSILEQLDKASAKNKSEIEKLFPAAEQELEQALGNNYYLPVVDPIPESKNRVALGEKQTVQDQEKSQKNVLYSGLLFQITRCNPNWAPSQEYDNNLVLNKKTKKIWCNNLLELISGLTTLEQWRYVKRVLSNVDHSALKQHNFFSRKKIIHHNGTKEKTSATWCQLYNALESRRNEILATGMIGEWSSRVSRAKVA